MNKLITNFKEWCSINENTTRETVLIKEVNPKVTITIKLDRAGHILDIINPFNIRFPWIKGQLLQRTYETWAKVNGYQIQGQSNDNEKINGIPKKLIPHGHPLRYVHPNKFRK